MLSTIFDTETTGLLGPQGCELADQPYITEIYAVQVNAKFEVVREFESLIKPPVPIPKHITKITGISDDTLKNAPCFEDVYRGIVSVFFKSAVSVGHNLAFDEGMLVNELRRIGKEHAFPYPPIKYCTVEQSMHIKGYRLKNGELYKITTGKELTGAHRAKADVLATLENYKYLKGLK